MNNITFEEVKDMLKRSIDETATVNDAIERTIQQIYLKGWNDAKNDISQQKTGQWIKYSVPRCGEQHYQCTSCGYYINFGQWGKVYTKQFKYCPNCGCRMVSHSKAR